MNLSLEEDLEARLEDFPQIVQRLPDILREQIALEEWRSRRYSEDARVLVREVMEEDGRPQTEDERFQSLADSLAAISPYFAGQNG